jgi:hypothetical protein
MKNAFNIIQLILMIGMLIISFVEIVYNTNTLLEKIWFTFTYTVSSYYIIKRIPV